MIDQITRSIFRVCFDHSPKKKNKIKKKERKKREKKRKKKRKKDRIGTNVW